jgi:hypothetical protein
MSNIDSKKQKFALSTDTDLHFDMLADHSKLKIMPSLIEQNNNLPSLDEDNRSSDSEIIENESDEIDSPSESPKFYNNNEQENKILDEDKRDFSHFNDEEKTDFLRQKAIHDFNRNNYKNYAKEKEKSKYDSSDSNSVSKSKKEIPTLNELKNMDEVPFYMLDSQTQKFKKMEKYAELLSIKRAGITLTKNYNLDSDYEEMCFEVKYWNDFQNKKDGVELGKGFLVNAVTALEFMNESYDPFGLKLKGWSEQMELNKESYSSVLGELYDKYKSSGKKMEPEIKLILMISASAASFHASKKMAESLPGLDSVLQSNPELLSKLQGAINTNISNQGKKKTESQEEIQKKMYDQMQKVKQQQQRLEELKKAQANVNSNTQKIEEQMSMLNRTQNVKKDNEGRADLSSILSKIKAQNVARKADEVINNKLSESSSSSEDERVSIKSEKNSDSISGTSITLGSDGKPKKKKRSGKSTISIVTTE